jgi:methyl-accepting chemotaxis protein
MISQSKSEIEAGLEVSQRCSEAFEGILTQVRDANVGIQGISLASKEQSQGIEEISHAVVQMDQVTQQNSATAQQVKTLAEELRDNSGRMNASVGNLQVFVHGSKKAEEQMATAAVAEPSMKDQNRSSFKAAA